MHQEIFDRKNDCQNQRNVIILYINVVHKQLENSTS